MSVRLALVRLHLPALVRRAILRELIAAIARAFARPCPPMSGLSAEELLACAIDVSNRWAEDALGRVADRSEIQRRLFSEAFALGRRARRRLGVRSEEEGLAAASVLYDAIGIEFSSRHGGSVLVPRCAFAGAYGPDICRLMSAMDSGLIAGLTGSAGLRFTQRLTEGAVACRASVVHSGGGLVSPRAIVVGSGAGGATVARELQGAFDVTILEAGGVLPPALFRPADDRASEALASPVRPEADPRAVPGDACPVHAARARPRERRGHRRDDHDRDRERPPDGR